MRSLISLARPRAPGRWRRAPSPTTSRATTPAPGPQILSSIGFTAATGGPPTSSCSAPPPPRPPPSGSPAFEAEPFSSSKASPNWPPRSASPRPPNAWSSAASIDVHAPKLPIVWEKPLELRRVPSAARSHASSPRERWQGAPLMAASAAAQARRSGSPSRPASRATSASPTCCRRSPISASSRPFRSAPSLGLLRFRLPQPRRPRLLRRALAQGRHRRPPRRRLALLRSRPRSATPTCNADRGLSPPRHPGLRLARTAARQREVLGRPSRVARENRPPAGRPTRLAQAR